MRIAYLDCASGVSGDMTLGALVDAGADFAAIQAGVASLGLPTCQLVRDEVKRKGFRATKVRVEYEPEHVHRHLHHITAMIDGGSLTDAQKDLAKRIFTRLGRAEAKAHGVPIEKVHFHEVGAADSIADIVGSAIGWDLLGVDRVVCSPVPTGQGFVKIAHGRVSIPAPATAELLTGIPLAPSAVKAELTTPTGAAIVATLTDEFGPVPAMTVDAIGYGAGDRDFEEQPNLLRILVGHASDAQHSDQVWVLETNLDDCSGELIGHCCTLLMEAGALDVFTTAIQMKKNRPGVMLSVLCTQDLVPEMERILFRETTTLGVRRCPMSRRKLRRQQHDVDTPWGRIEGKLALDGDQIVRYAPEYESCRRVAADNNQPVRVVYEAACKAFRPENLPAEGETD